MTGYDSAKGDAIKQLFDLIAGLGRRLSEVERPTGTQRADALAQLRQLVNDLPAQIYAVLATAVNTGDVNASGTITATAGITSIGVYNLDVSTLPAGRRTNWVHNSGAIGYAPSSIVKKTDVQSYSGSAETFLKCQPVVFYYMGQIAIRDDPANPNYDPNYVVPLEVGHIAEWLIENGLSEFVFYDEDGVTPAGINYAEFAAVGFIVVGRAHEERLARLEALVL